jgi:hypothetical protein
MNFNDKHSRFRELDMKAGIFDVFFRVSFKSCFFSYENSYLTKNQAFWEFNFYKYMIQTFLLMFYDVDV